MKKYCTLTAVAAAAVAPFLGGGSAHASPDFDTFDANDEVWGCADEAGVPPHHCINLKSQGDTNVILVFPPDDRWPQEGFSTNPRSDTRPCPHDPASTDGTWWSPYPGFWVCHHRP